MTGSDSSSIEVKKWRYDAVRWATLIPGLILFAIMVIQAFTAWNTNIYEWSLCVLFLAYYATSIRKTETYERCGIMVLEEPAFEGGPGYYYVPRILAEMDKMPMNVVQFQFPGNPEQISKRPDEEGLLPGQVHPIRTPTGPKLDEDGDDPLNNRMTLEVLFAVRWQLRPQGFFDLYVNIPGRRWKDKVESIKEHMRDTGETELVEELAKRSPYRLIKEMETVNRELKAQLQKAVTEWGIEIKEARMQAPDIPHDVNIALASIAQQQANRAAAVIKAEGEKTSTILVAEGEKQARLLAAEARERELEAEGKGLGLAAKAAGIDAGTYFGGRIAEGAVKKGDLILGADGITQLMGLGKALTRESKKDTEPKGDTE